MSESATLETLKPRKRRGGFKRSKRRGGKTVVYVGMDLSTTTDMTAYVLAAPEYSDDGSIEEISIFPRFFLPGSNIVRLERDARVPYRACAEQGYLTLTEGDVVDYQYVRLALHRDADAVHIHKAGIDPYNASQFTTELMADGFHVEHVRQGALTMGPFTKETERLILEGRLRHPNNPILNWHISNCTLRRDVNDNYWPMKTDGGVGQKAGS